ncbi:MAG: hypothetical protein WBO77_03865 [Microgenomates group bacterium]
MKILYGLLLTAMIGVNIYLFAQGIVVSDNVQKLELSTQKLKTENSELQAKLYNINSLSNLELIAQDLGFTQKSQPLFLDTPAYASR